MKFQRMKIQRMKIIARQTARHSEHRARGFSMVEVVTVIALLGIFAALAVPSLAPMSRGEQISGASEAVAGFLATARIDAMSSRRCTRVTISQNTAPPTLQRWRLNVYDCGDSLDAAQSSANAALINPAIGSHWQLVESLALFDAKSLEIHFTNGAVDDVAPPATNPHPKEVPPHNVPEIRYRPTGRLYSDNALNFNNFDGAIVVRHPDVPGKDTFIIAESHGPICVQSPGIPLAGPAHEWSCPYN